MPRKPRPWFRFYVEAVRDRKLRRLPPVSRWVWVVVLALARQSPVPGTLYLAGESILSPLDAHDVADEAGVRLKDARDALASFEAQGMVARTDDGAWLVARWSARQFESDDVTERTRKHRSNEQRRNVPTSADGTTTYREQISEVTEALSPSLRLLVDAGATEDEAREILAALPKADPPVKRPEGWLRRLAQSNGDLEALVARHRESRPTPLPPWCGQCEQDTRLVPHGDAYAYCPRCHPQAVAR